MQPSPSSLVSTYMKQLTTIKSLTIITLLFIGTTLFTSCSDDGMCIKGNNNQSTTSYSPTDFESITLDGSFNVEITQGDTYEIEVTGDDNIIDYFEYDIRNGNCVLSLEDGCYKNYDLRVEITTPTLEGIYLDGSGDIKVQNFEDMTSLEVRLDGSGNIRFNELNGLKNADFNINGSGNITIQDEESTLDNNIIQISGSGNYNGFKLISNNVEAYIDGSGNIDTHAESNLKARISGSGNIRYKGSPVVDAMTSGSGNISRK